jgi:peptidoglycan/xylan/chitin deacetylase (PgdA/CDA1 family)
VNSGLTGTGSYYMTWEQVAGLAADANEIAGHTLTHVNIGSLSYADARYQVCQDRVNLFNRGYQPTSFAYPSGGVSDTARKVVQDCGYNSGRTAGGISKVCKCAELIPPADPWRLGSDPLPFGWQWKERLPYLRPLRLSGLACPARFPRHCDPHREPGDRWSGKAARRAVGGTWRSQYWLAAGDPGVVYGRVVSQ